MARRRGLLARIGPAFIVGACLIGPGSVTLMSRTGALYGYSMLWLAVLSGALMAGFIGLFMRFGIYSDETFLGLAAKKLGRPFAVHLLSPPTRTSPACPGRTCCSRRRRASPSAASAPGPCARGACTAT